ncbi:MAG: XRE family transcriptional regulator [Sulfurovum sp.]|nr:XRE family transcriptional regulator [Sulfurovum sp.]
MERIDFINTKRLQWCCDEIGITVEELSKKTKVSLGALKSLFEGKKGLTYNQLKKLAEFFGRGVFFFLEEGDAAEEKVHSANFRTLTNQKPYLSLEMRKFIERVEKKRDEFLWLLEEIEGEQPNFTFPDLEGSVENRAMQIRAWLNLSNTKNFDTYREALEAKGIFVLQSNGYAGKWKIPNESPILGFSLWHQKMPVIVIKKQRAKERQTFTLIHELAHLVLHQQSIIDDEQDIWGNSGSEKEANRFAGTLLVPMEFLDTIDIEQIPSRYAEYRDWLGECKKECGVSTEVILRRLVDTKRLSLELYQKYRSWLKQQTLPESSGGQRYRDREPLHMFGKRYVQQVLDAKSYDVITLVKASRFLDNIKINTLHQLEKYLVSNH